MTPASIRLEVESSRRLAPLAAANEVQHLRIRQHAATGMICSEIGQIPRRREVRQHHNAPGSSSGAVVTDISCSRVASGCAAGL